MHVCLSSCEPSPTPARSRHPPCAARVRPAPAALQGRCPPSPVALFLYELLFFHELMGSSYYLDLHRPLFLLLLRISKNWQSSLVSIGFLAFLLQSVPYLLLRKKAITNLDSVLKSRDITLLTKVHRVKTMFLSSSHIWM